MSMITQYARLRDGDLADLRVLLRTDHFAANDQITDQPHVDVDKAWGGLEFLLAQVDAPVDVISGGVPITDEQWGYDSPRVLTPEEVATAAAFLDVTPFADLAAHYEPAALTADDVYPMIWHEPGSLDYLRSSYETLVAFFHAAAADGDSVVIWMS
ncbi:YfbM family protein [Dactylosporangium sp. NPDC049742]|uniref:YfbM family protein n=1 Tax=Dactylosporangium sp. NPDC049742 TaxID=3154737 RepID=UPI0034139430